MKTGAYFFSLSKKNKVVNEVVPNNYVLLSNDEKLHTALEKNLGKKVTLVSSISKNILNSFSGNIQILFDVKFVDFKTVIATMESLSRSEVTFRNVNDRFTIGSDSSNNRGEVRTFALER